MSASETGDSILTVFHCESTNDSDADLSRSPSLACARRTAQNPLLDGLNCPVSTGRYAAKNLHLVSCEQTALRRYYQNYIVHTYSTPMRPRSTAHHTNLTIPQSIVRLEVKCENFIHGFIRQTGSKLSVASSPRPNCPSPTRRCPTNTRSVDAIIPLWMVHLHSLRNCTSVRTPQYVREPWFQDVPVPAIVEAGRSRELK